MKLSEINSLKKKAKNLRIKTFIEFIKKGEAPSWREFFNDRNSSYTL